MPVPRRVSQLSVSQSAVEETHRRFAVPLKINNVGRARRRRTRMLHPLGQALAEDFWTAKNY